MCNQNFPNIQLMMKHLHSEMHTKQVDPQQVMKNDPPKKEVLDKNSKLWPVSGVEFMKPLCAYYCSLCKEILPDQSYAEHHLKGNKHIKTYMIFLEDNPVYQRKHELLKEAAVVLADFEKRQKELEEMHQAKASLFSTGEMKDKGSVHQVQGAGMRTNKNEGKLMQKSHFMGSNKVLIKPIKQREISKNSQKPEVASTLMKKKKDNTILSTDEPTPASLSTNRLTQSTNHVSGENSEEINNNFARLRMKDVCVIPSTEKELPAPSFSAIHKPDLSYLSTKDQNGQAMKSSGGEMLYEKHAVLFKDAQQKKNPEKSYEQVKNVNVNKEESRFISRSSEHILSKDSVQQESSIQILDREMDERSMLKNDPVPSNNKLVTDVQKNDKSEKSLEVEVEDVNVNKEDVILTSTAHVQHALPSLSDGEKNQSTNLASNENADAINDNLLYSGSKQITAVPSIRKEQLVSLVPHTEKLILSSSASDLNDKAMQMSGTEMLFEKNCAILKDVQLNKNSEKTNEVEIFHVNESNLVSRSSEHPIQLLSTGDQTNQCFYRALDGKPDLMDKVIHSDFACAAIKDVSDCPSFDKRLPASAAPLMDEPSLATTPTIEFINKCKVLQVPSSEQQSERNSARLVQRSLLNYFKGSKAQKYEKGSKVEKYSINSCSEDSLPAEKRNDSSENFSESKLGFSSSGIEESKSDPQPINVKESSPLLMKANDGHDQPTIISPEIFVLDDDKNKMSSSDSLVKDFQQNSDSNDSHKVGCMNMIPNQEKDNLMLSYISNLTEDFHDMIGIEKSNVSNFHCFEIAFTDLKQNCNASSEMERTCTEVNEKDSNSLSEHVDQQNRNATNSSTSNFTSISNENVFKRKKNVEFIEDHLHKIQRADDGLKTTQIVGVTENKSNNDMSSCIEIVFERRKENVDSTSIKQEIIYSTGIEKLSQEDISSQDSMEYLKAIQPTCAAIQHRNKIIPVGKKYKGNENEETEEEILNIYADSDIEEILQDN